MKEAIVAPDTTVQIHDVAIPEPGPGELLVKVLVSGTHPAHQLTHIFLQETSLPV